MFKKYNPKLVKSYKTYTLDELCRLYREDQLHKQTIRAWIKKSGLDCIRDGNKYLIYGAIFKQFLLDRNKNRKHKLQFSDFFCYKCKQVNSPLEATILSVSIKNNSCICASGICPNCAAEMKRFYKLSDIPKIIANYQIEPEALMVLSDISSSAHKAHLITDQKLLRSESEVTAPSKNQTCSSLSTRNTEKSA